MASIKKDKAAKVKDLAINGDFQEIKSLYGLATEAKAKEYVRKN